MKRIVLVFGLLSGAITAVLMWLMLIAMRYGGLNSEHGMFWGYASMIISLSMVFFGVKSFRDNNGGHVTFLKGLQIGILISLIAALFYGISWEIYYQTLGGNFMAEYMTAMLNKMQAAGNSAAEIDAARTQMENMAAMYKNFFFRFAMTMVEIVPVGIVVTLVSAALLRKREVLPAIPA